MMIEIKSILKMNRLCAVIGNSGAGKDTIIEEVQNTYPSHYRELKVAKRVITRESSDTEKFEPVDAETFHRLRESGEFILEWESYGNFYGIRRVILDWLRDGHPVLMNISRTVVQRARDIFPDMKVIFIRVPLEVTAERIIERGREPYQDVLSRVVRAQDHIENEDADIIVDNIGELEKTTKKVLGFILGTLE